jgi:hypothetical protein
VVDSEDGALALPFFVWDGLRGGVERMGSLGGLVSGPNSCDGFLVGTSGGFFFQMAPAPPAWVGGL